MCSPRHLHLPFPFFIIFLVSLFMLVAAPAVGAQSGRMVIPLDGEWEVEDGLDPQTIRSAFTNRAPVPGLVDLAAPPFEEVGRPSTKRSWFFYRTELKLPQKCERVLLRVRKPRFGSRVWVNGQPAGERAGSPASE